MILKLPERRFVVYRFDTNQVPATICRTSDFKDGP